MLNFEKNFFDGEERDGFYIEPMMKNAWAAQLGVLMEIDRICRENNITYFADWGTLLGAVRHAGFIPWDDDMDIGMLRPDYMKFLDIMQNKQDKLVCVSIFNDPSFGGHPAKILNSTEFTVSRKKIKENYGFPFMAGIDVFPIDYIPRDDKLKEEQIGVLNLILKARHLKIEMQDYSPVSVEYMTGVKMLSELLKEIETACNISFSQENPTDQELMILYEEVAGLYGDEDADYVAAMHRLLWGQEYLIPKAYYAETKMVPFENIQIPIPIGYDLILQKKYGENYMTPINQGGGHDYPFYNTLISKMAQLRNNSVEATREYILNISTNYYQKFLHKSPAPSVFYDTKFWDAEEVDGFMITKEQKKVWAALSEILCEISRVCKKYNIPFWAIGSTLQDTVQHHSLNIEGHELQLAMKREDYVTFMNIFQMELSPWFNYSCIYTNQEHKDLKCYIYPDNYLCESEEFAERFHDCKDFVKISISVLDAVEPDAQLDDVRKWLVLGLLTTSKNVSTIPPYSSEEIEIAREWMEVTEKKIDLEGNLSAQLLELADRVAGAYRGTCEMLRMTADLQNGKDSIFKKVWYDETIEIPVGDITIPVPIGYQNMLK